MCLWKVGKHSFKLNFVPILLKRNVENWFYGSLDKFVTNHLVILKWRPIFKLPKKKKIEDNVVLEDSTILYNGSFLASLTFASSDIKLYILIIKRKKKRYY